MILRVDKLIRILSVLHRRLNPSVCSHKPHGAPLQLHSASSRFLSISSKKIELQTDEMDELRLPEYADDNLKEFNLNSQWESTEKKEGHLPVLCKEVLECFWRLDNLGDKNVTILDMTFGSGGHSSAILETFPECKIIALDRDPLARDYAAKLQEKYPNQVLPITGKFSQLSQLLKENCINKPLDGILLDAGCSSMQMDQGERGFAFSKPEYLLDMRMGGSEEVGSITAAQVVNRSDEEMLANIFYKYGEEKQSKKIARALVESRFMMKQIQTTGDLADVVAEAVGGTSRMDRLGRRQHPATKIFQALRIFVNDELNELDFALNFGHQILRPNGIFVAISFHSLEDKIIKDHFQSADWRDKLKHDPANPHRARLYRNYSKWLPKEDMMDMMAFRWQRLNRKVILPSDYEIHVNPRSRSAKLRAAFKL